LESDLEVKGDKRIFVEAGEAVDVFHHPRWAMKDLEEIAKKLLSPTANLVNGADIFQNFLNGTAIAEPEKFGAPEKFAILSNSPATAASFADKRMIMAFALGAAAGAEANRPEAGTIHGQVESAKAVRTEKSEGSFGGIGIVRLHKDPAHAGASPVCL
jgi:hypothetical protein